ncbi:hypothetical protein BDN72DRAFT_883985 [Pluteus cervinus]|uniref:Uncharacterized protein n=1 Tax=Pluteus cervinus TaxID=181527 RepID=A0ACD3A0Z5_9AGAR|nr:hypothetical protein BDN72DRAFT_883985 [Pluteus cervinus]
MTVLDLVRGVLVKVTATFFNAKPKHTTFAPDVWNLWWRLLGYKRVIRRFYYHFPYHFPTTNVATGNVKLAFPNWTKVIRRTLQHATRKPNHHHELTTSRPGRPSHAQEPPISRTLSNDGVFQAILRRILPCRSSGSLPECGGGESKRKKHEPQQLRALTRQDQRAL